MQYQYHAVMSDGFDADESDGPSRTPETRSEPAAEGRVDTPLVRRGRGALSNRAGRFESLQHIDIDDGWHALNESDSDRRTQWRDDKAKSVISRNRSPDLHFDRSINPYRGCEHGCVYCYARPSHAFLGHSPGLDFERRLYAKRGAAERLREELARPGYASRNGGIRPMAIGVNTDAYQPLERELGITRSILEVLLEARHPVYLITKGSLIERDLDLLGELASRNLVSVTVSLTTLDNALARRLEPRATAPQRRLRTLRTLAGAGIPTRVSVSPVIPALNEHEIESLIEAAALAGACAANAILLRLPHELASLFPEWLEAHYPLRKARVLKAMRSVRAGSLNDSGFGTRFIGEGPRAELIRQRFEKACRQHGVSVGRVPFALDTTVFRAPATVIGPASGFEASLGHGPGAPTTVSVTAAMQLSLFGEADTDTDTESDSDSDTGTEAGAGVGVGVAAGAGADDSEAADSTVACANNAVSASTVTSQ